MADNGNGTFTPAPGTGYFNLSGPNQGLTGLGAGPIGPSKPGYVQGTASTVPIPSPAGNNPAPGGTYVAPSGGGGNPQGGGVTPDGSYSAGYHGSSGQTGPTQDEINAQINDTYNSSNNYLNQAEQQVNKDYPTVQQDIGGQYDASKGQLDVSHTSNINQFNQQTDQADYGHETALASARRLYSELRQGYQQRFGGSTSAGDAANQYASVEQQRQEGQQNHGYQDTLTTINNHKTDTENQYQQGVQGLLQQKSAALNQANRDFQNKLLTISQSRAMNEQAKGQAKLQVLQDLRNQVFAINQQNTQFQQTLEAQKQQSQLQLQNYQALSGQHVGGAGQAAAAYGLMAGQRPTSNLQVGGQAPQQSQQPTGQIGGSKGYDQYGNPIV